MSASEKQSNSAAGECPPPGTFCWNEMIASDVTVATKFYTQMFGWRAEAMPAGADYTIFKQGDRMIGGMMPRMNPQVPAHWLAYIMVDNIEASLAKATGLGAKVIVPTMEISVGKVAVFLDPQGAALGLFQPGPQGAK